jgi:hypothetical protein
VKWISRGGTDILSSDNGSGTVKKLFEIYESIVNVDFSMPDRRTIPSIIFRGCEPSLFFMLGRNLPWFPGITQKPRISFALFYGLRVDGL